MVNEVGSISIVGTIDVASIKAGLAQVKSGLDSAKESAKSTLGDMEGLGKALGGIGTKLLGVGIAAGTAMIGLASIGPAAAPAMARIEFSMFKLSQVLAEQLQPAFDMFADKFEGFLGWLNSEEGKGVLSLVNDTLVKIMGTVENMEYWFDKLTPAIDLATSALKGFFDVVLPSTPGDNSINEQVKKDISKETPSNVLSSGLLGGISMAAIGKTLLGAGLTGMAVPGIVMGTLVGLINSIVEPMNKSYVTSVLQDDSLKEQAYAAYKERGQDTALLDEVYGKLEDYAYDMNEPVNVSGGQSVKAGWWKGYSNESALTKEWFDLNGFQDRNQ